MRNWASSTAAPAEVRQLFRDDCFLVRDLELLGCFLDLCFAILISMCIHLVSLQVITCLEVEGAHVSCGAIYEVCSPALAFDIACLCLSEPESVHHCGGFWISEGICVTFLVPKIGQKCRLIMSFHD